MYCTVKDVKDALAPVVPGNTKDLGTAIGLSDEQITDAINEADSTIDAYLGGKYQIPTQEIEQDEEPAVVAASPVRYWSRNIAAWNATLTYKRNKDVSENDPVRLRYVGTMNLLTQVRDGELVLPFPDPEGQSDGDTEIINLYNGRLWDSADFGLVPGGGSWLPGRWPGGPGGW